MHGEHLIVEQVDRTLVLTLNRPEALNSVNAQMAEEIGQAYDRFAADPALWVAVITGAGERAFCAGADLRQVGTGPRTLSAAARRRGFAGFVRQYSPKPVIAAVNGLALGGGAEIVLACDMAIAADTATFAFPEVRHGLVAAAGGLLRLPRQLPPKVALYHLTTGEPMTAAQALHWGLVNQVLPRERVLPAALALAARICENAPLAVRTSKDVVYRGLDAPLDFPAKAWGINAEALLQLRASEDYREGPRAFRERRKPQWKGR